MFAFIKGTLNAITPNYAVLENHGIGYQIFIPISTYGTLIHHTGEITLYTSYIVREDSQRLFGFLSLAEKDFFEALSDVSGIGPKTALGIVGHITAEDFQRSIIRGDLLSLSKIPGIGKKTAERLVVEMKDKLSKLSSSVQLDLLPKATESPVMQDALSALINLGYQQQAAQKALKKIQAETEGPLELATLIRQALKVI